MVSRKLLGRRVRDALLAAFWLTAASSCGMMKPAKTDNDEAQKVMAPAAPRVTGDALAKAGLVDLGYYDPDDIAKAGGSRDPRDGAVESVYLLPQGLVLVTRPARSAVGAPADGAPAGGSLAGGQRLIKFLDRDSVSGKWWEPADGPIREAPFAYEPPTRGQTPELYYRIHDTIYCLDLRFGAKLWTKNVNWPISSRIVANDSHVFFGADNSRFYGYEKNNAVQDWQYRTGGAITSSPALANGMVVFGSHDGHIYGMLPGQGYVSLSSWDHKTGNRIVGDVVPYSRWFFAGSTDYKLYCLESDGSVYWSFGAEAPIRDTPVVYRVAANKEYVYCISSDGSLDNPRRTLFAVPLPKGELAPVGRADWRKEDVRRVLSISDNTLYVLNDGEPSISGLDVETGEERFRLSIEGFHFVPTNSADSGRNKDERAKIYLVSRTGVVQVIGEKR